MDQTNLLKHFAEAQRHVAAGERNLARQRALIERLRRYGCATRSARALLERMEESQALHLADLRRVRATLKGDARTVS